jgi:sulfite exporter TauE/SafE
MEPLVKASKKNPSLQTKINSIQQKMQANLEKLHVQKNFWKPHNIALCWGLLSCK